MSISNFERQLETYYKQHRNQQLALQLEGAVQTMRETLLLGAIFMEIPEEIKDRSEGFSPSDDTVQNVEQVKEALEANRFNQIEDLLPELTKSLSGEEQQVRGKIQGVKHELSSHLQGLKSLNRRINRIRPDRIKAIEDEVGNLDSVSYESEQQFTEQEQTIQQYVRQNVVEELEEIEDELMEPFRGSGAETHVRSLISGNSVKFSTLSEEEIDKLQDSLGTHLSLRLHGE